MFNEEKEWLDKLFEDKNMKLKHFKTLVYIFKQNDFAHYTKLNETEIMDVCEIKNKMTLIKMLNYFLENKYIKLKISNNGYYISLNKRTEDISQNLKLRINLDKLNDRKVFLTECLFNPFYVWGNIPKLKRKEIVNSYSEQEVKEILENKNFYIDYKSFLLTPYWKVVKDEVKQKYKCCQKCGSKKKLHIHHLTYEHHFYEHLFLDDLIVLCENCHHKEHL